MNKLQFSAAELSELESLEILGGNTANPMSQEECSNRAEYCGGGVTQKKCVNLAIKCGILPNSCTSQNSEDCMGAQSAGNCG